MAANSNGGLAVSVTICSKRPIGIAEGEPAKEDVVDGLLCGRITFEKQELLQLGRDDFGVAQVFTRFWPISKDAGLAVEIPFAWRIEGVRGVLDIVLRVIFLVRFARVARKGGD